MDYQESNANSGLDKFWAKTLLHVNVKVLELDLVDKSRPIVTDRQKFESRDELISKVKFGVLDYHNSETMMKKDGFTIGYSRETKNVSD